MRRQTSNNQEMTMNDNSKQTLSNTSRSRENTINISFTEFLHLAQAELQRSPRYDEDAGNELALITAWLPELKSGPWGEPTNIREAVGTAWFVGEASSNLMNAAFRLWEQYEFKMYEDWPAPFGTLAHAKYAVRNL
jgi:hypothetical protein